MPVAAEQECRPPQLRRRGLREFSELLVRCHLTSAPQSCPARGWHVRASMPACRHTTDAPGAALGCVAPPKKVSLAAPREPVVVQLIDLGRLAKPAQPSTHFVSSGNSGCGRPNWHGAAMAMHHGGPGKREPRD